MNIFVGNMSFDTIEAHLKKLFEGFGTVVSVVIVMDENGKKSRGFGFLEMSDRTQAEKAIAALDGKDFMGRPLRVNPSQPKSEKVREISDCKEVKKRLKAEKRQMASQRKPMRTAGRSQDFKDKGDFLGGRRTLRPVRLSAEERVAQPKSWEKREAGAKPWKKTAAATKLVKRTPGKSRPWEKRLGVAKSWHKNKAGG